MMILSNVALGGDDDHPPSLSSLLSLLSLSSSSSVASQFGGITHETALSELADPSSLTSHASQFATMTNSNGGGTG